MWLEDGNYVQRFIISTVGEPVIKPSAPDETPLTSDDYDSDSSPEILASPVRPISTPLEKSPGKTTSINVAILQQKETPEFPASPTHPVEKSPNKTPSKKTGDLQQEDSPPTKIIKMSLNGQETQEIKEPNIITFGCSHCHFVSGAHQKDWGSLRFVLHRHITGKTCKAKYVVLKIANVAVSSAIDITGDSAWAKIKNIYKSTKDGQISRYFMCQVTSDTNSD